MQKVAMELFFGRKDLATDLNNVFGKALHLWNIYLSLKVRLQMLVKQMTREDEDYVTQGEITAVCQLQRES